MPQMSQIQIKLNAKSNLLPSSDKLGFGQYFTDHMFCLNYEEGPGWNNPRVIPYQNLSLDPAACVFHYGQALFEGMKAFRQTNGKIALFRPSFNTQRMSQGAARLCMQAPPEDLLLAGIRELVKVDQKWVPADRSASLYIRPTLIATEPFLGVRPSKEYLCYVILSPVGSYYKEGVNPIKIWVEEEYVRATPGGLGATKAGANYAASLLAAMQARTKGYAQVLWLDVNHHFIEEVGTMNVFFRIGDTVITPELNGSILSGGTRECALRLLYDHAVKLGIKVEERKITMAEVMAAQKNKSLKEAFGTGTAAVISPIGELHYQEQAWEIGNGKMGSLAQFLYQEITSIQYGEKPDLYNWIEQL